jgi:hypothetical protein
MTLMQVIRRRNRSLRGWLGSVGLFGPLRPPLLVVGSPNSGTQVLAEAIRAHPAIADRSELRMLWDEDFHTRRNDTRRTAADVRPADRRRLRGNFAWYQRVTGAQVLMNRHPENSLRIPFMRGIFPDAKLVHIVRDGRAAVCSNYTSAQRKEERRIHPFGGYARPPGWREWLDRPLLEQLSYMWSSAVLHATREGAALGDDFLEVRYEDLPTRSRELIARIWELVGLEVHEEYLERLPVFEDRNYKWRKTLTPAEVATIEDVAGEALRHFGYLPGR